jgi:hypothetical protein
VAFQSTTDVGMQELTDGMQNPAQVTEAAMPVDPPPVADVNTLVGAPGEPHQEP